MTHAVALTGQWEGLRAIPRTLRTPDHRKRLEDGLERLGGLFEQMAFRATLLAAGMDRLNGLRASMIDQLDALDAPTEGLEPSGDDEPALCHSGALGSDSLDGLEDDRADWEPDNDDEPSLCGEIGLPHHGHAVGGGAVGMGSFGEIVYDLEGQCDDEGHDSDREPDDEFGALA